METFVSGVRIQEILLTKKNYWWRCLLCWMFLIPAASLKSLALRTLSCLLITNWFKWSHIGQHLGIARIITSTTKLSEEDIRSLAFLNGGFAARIPPREDPQDHDIFILLTGALYVTVNSKKDKGKALNKHIMKHIVSRRFDAKIEEIQDKHGQVTE